MCDEKMTKKVKNLEHFKKFLRKMERLPQSAIEDVMGTWGKGYIDTPGFYHRERHMYNNDIIYFMKSNMGGDFDRLKQWYINNPEKVKQIMKL